MSAPPDLRRGWCPSLLRPMQSGDGLLLRLQPPCGVLPPILARGIALCAKRFGNGLVDLTRHGNLQLRGIGEAALPALQTQLCELLPSLAEDGPDAARNIIASPLAGLDPQAICDIRPIVAGLERRLAGDPALWELPAKFSFLIDDGGRLGLDDVVADVRFAAEHGGEPRFALSVGGSSDTATPIGSCAAPELPEMAAALALAFLELRGDGNEAPRRIRDLVARIGAEAIADAVLSARQISADCEGREAISAGSSKPTRITHARRAFPLPACGERWPEARSAGGPVRGRVSSRSAGFHSLGPSPAVSPGPSPGETATSPRERGEVREGRPLIGFHLLEDQTGFLGVGAPFGRLDADQLDHLADAAETSQAELRLTPWRAVLIAPIDEARAAEFQHSLASLGLITEPADPRLAIAACPGAPACANASVRTREDALLLAPLARRLSAPRGGIGLHLSGCLKGCAKSDTTPVTLVGRDGRYDVVFDGRPGDVPAYSGLTAQEAKALLLRTERRHEAAAMIGNKG